MEEKLDQIIKLLKDILNVLIIFLFIALAITIGAYVATVHAEEQEDLDRAIKVVQPVDLYYRQPKPDKPKCHWEYKYIWVSKKCLKYKDPPPIPKDNKKNIYLYILECEETESWEKAVTRELMDYSDWEIVPIQDSAPGEMIIWLRRKVCEGGEK